MVELEFQRAGARLTCVWVAAGWITVVTGQATVAVWPGGEMQALLARICTDLCEHKIFLES